MELEEAILRVDPSSHTKTYHVETDNFEAVVTCTNDYNLDIEIWNMEMFEGDNSKNSLLEAGFFSRRQVILYHILLYRVPSDKSFFFICYNRHNTGYRFFKTGVFIGSCLLT